VPSCRAHCAAPGDLARAREWFASPEYAPLVVLRQRTARTKLVFADGI
jgi:uncharacterized protein (DUF1330 family)